MTIDEGYVKYLSDWKSGPPPDETLVRDLIDWRRPLYAAGLIGHYEEFGIGFGNISIRGVEPRTFVISTTQTGHLDDTGPEHYVLVTDYDIEDNRVTSTGPLQASSEAMTHAAIYDLSDNIGAIVHAHNKLLWMALADRVPTTRQDVAYGTPEMAEEFSRLWNDSDFAASGCAVMAGHEEGLVSIGASLQEAADRLLDLVRV